MLVQLRIRDFVLIDHLDLEFSAGFNVLTGETGAGKSLIATAVDLLLGRRARGETVRYESHESEIEGLFDISDETEVKARLQQAGLPEDDELLIRRVISTSGRHRCYVNGRLVSLSLLSELSSGLASMMSQHEQHSLLEPLKQRDVLDDFGDLQGEVAKMGELFRNMEGARDKLVTLRNRERDRVTRREYVSYQLGEIEKIAPLPGELEEIEREISRLSHMEKLLTATGKAAFALYEQEGSAFDILGSAIRLVEDAAEFDEALGPCARQLEEAGALVEDCARVLSGYGPREDLDPRKLSELEERKADLLALMRKHGTDLEGVCELLQTFRAELETLAHFEEALEEAKAELREAEKAAENLAARLSQKRIGIARKLAKAVNSELHDLEFGRARFDVQIEKASNGLGAHGRDRVEFLVELNPGEGAHPLRRVVSGGELSRLMLAIRRAMAGVGPVGTYIFDEVDTGIGGSVAAAVGRKLREVTEHHQVICITHLPQIAGMADTHFVVSKAAQGGRTATQISRLSSKERVEEIARMLGGTKVTNKIRAAAKELIT